jgi:hypothetical protein
MVTVVTTGPAQQVATLLGKPTLAEAAPALMVYVLNRPAFPASDRFSFSISGLTSSSSSFSFKVVYTAMNYVDAANVASALQDPSQGFPLAVALNGGQKPFLPSGATGWSTLVSTVTLSSTGVMYPKPPSMLFLSLFSFTGVYFLLIFPCLEGTSTPLSVRLRFNVQSGNLSSANDMQLRSSQSKTR